MNEDSEWFAAKRYGFGAGLPISWQGWAVMLSFLAIVAVIAYFFGDQPLKLIGIIVPLSAALAVITSRTTRGGWRWRWGDED
jgi:hypothetical protein